MKKYCSSSYFIAACWMLSVLSLSAQVRFDEPLFSWPTKNDTQGWTISEAATTLESRGGLLFFKTGVGLNCLESPDHLGLSGDSYNQVELELRNKSGANQALLYYITDADTQWDATKSVAIPIGTNDSFNRRYALELPTLPDETFRVAIFCRLRRTRSALPNGLINSRRNRLEG